MRSRLVVGTFAMTYMIALAFAIPLGLLNQQRARDEAIAEARVRLAVAVAASGRSAVGPSTIDGEMLQQRLDVGSVAVRIPPKEGVVQGWLLIAGLVFLLVAGCVIAANRFGKRWHGDREFAADLSHRLRTPLTALQLDVDALPNGPDSDRMRDAIAALDSEIDAVIAESRRTPEQRAGEESDVVDVLADRLAFWAVLAEDHGRPWELTGDQERLLVRVPRADLIAAVDALLGNVFRHTPDGTPFRVGVTRNTLTVEDAGDGIANPQLSIQRGASGAGSTGLGLSIVEKVGKIQITRSPLGGAKITLTFR